MPACISPQSFEADEVTTNSSTIQHIVRVDIDWSVGRAANATDHLIWNEGPPLTVLRKAYKLNHRPGRQAAQLLQQLINRKSAQVSAFNPLRVVVQFVAHQRLQGVVAR